MQHTADFRVFCPLTNVDLDGRKSGDMIHLICVCQDLGLSSAVLPTSLLVRQPRASLNHAALLMVAVPCGRWSNWRKNLGIPTLYM